MQDPALQESSIVQYRLSSQTAPSLGDQPRGFLATSQIWQGFAASTVLATNGSFEFASSKYRERHTARRCSGRSIEASIPSFDPGSPERCVLLSFDESNGQVRAAGGTSAVAVPGLNAVLGELPAIL